MTDKWSCAGLWSRDTITRAESVLTFCGFCGGAAAQAGPNLSTAGSLTIAAKARPEWAAVSFAQPTKVSSAAPGSILPSRVAKIYVRTSAASRDAEGVTSDRCQKTVSRGAHHLWGGAEGRWRPPNPPTLMAGAPGEEPALQGDGSTSL
ncbi:MAG: hypothetical protein JRM85_02825 [Nitrososphaerota archaeon]|nr:hypothetical protein [Nitrososphaerota archaeon]MDG6918770.1 hypothetical protein [Nitrososphaerota archaeon]